MKRLLGWLATAALLVALLLLGVVAWVSVASERRLARLYDVPARQLDVVAAAGQQRRGAHVASTWGCLDCHGEDLSGGVVLDAPPLLLIAPNLTSGEGGVAARYSDRDWVRSIRHGVGPNGRPLLFMPSNEYWVMSDADLSALLAFVQSVPPVDAIRPPSTVRGLGRFLYLTGRLPLTPAEAIDHEAPRPTPPAPGATAEYGGYLATPCSGCHGRDFAGGPIPGAPPDWPNASNLTQNPSEGLGTWSRADFVRALREGTRPDGNAIDPIMPWRNTAAMSDTEIDAIWTYLQALPPAVRTPVDPGG